MATPASTAVGDLSASGASAGGTMSVAATNLSLNTLQSGGQMTVTAVNNATVAGDGTMQSDAGFAMGQRLPTWYGGEQFDFGGRAAGAGIIGGDAVTMAGSKACSAAIMPSR